MVTAAWGLTDASLFTIFVLRLSANGDVTAVMLTGSLFLHNAFPAQ